MIWESEHIGVYALWTYRAALVPFNFFFKVISDVPFIPHTSLKLNAFAAPYTADFGHWPLKFVELFHRTQKKPILHAEDNSKS